MTRINLLDMKRLVALIFVLAVCGTGAAARPGAYKTVKNIAYRDAGGDRNIDTMCRLDLYYPADKEGFSTVIWYHGGGLTGGRRDIPEALKEKGFAVVGVEYRLSPHVKVADCVDDAAASAAWVVKHIAEYGGDPRRIFVAGHSAGGYLTSMIGLDKRWLEPYGIDPDTTFAALIPYSGQVVTHFARRREMGIPDTQVVVDDMAPLNYVRPDCRPILILSGDREREMLGRYEENAYFWRMMRVAGHPDVRIYEFDGFDHGNMPQAGHFAAVRYIREMERKIEETAELLGISRLLNRHPYDLSGGEQQKAALSKLLLLKPKIMLLDEPTNDLDVETLSSLEKALLEFPGCAVVTSHDRMFLDRIATHILAWEGTDENPGNWFWFEGNFDSYQKNRIERLGEEASKPHRLHRKLTRD